MRNSLDADNDRFAETVHKRRKNALKDMQEALAALDVLKRRRTLELRDSSRDGAVLEKSGWTSPRSTQAVEVIEG